MAVTFADPARAFIHSSQQSTAIRQARVDSLRLGRVHHAFHYNTVRQTDLWLEVFRRHSPVIGNPEFGRIYQRCFERIAAEIAGKTAASANAKGVPQSVHVVGLGSGDGTKEEWLLEALAKAGVAASFTAVDVSAELALMAARRASSHLPESARNGTSADNQPNALVCDLLSFRGEELSDWVDSASPGHELRIFTFFGLFPNFEPASVFPWLRSILQPADLLLTSAHLAPTEPGDESPEAYAAGCSHVLPQYDNAATRAWLHSILQDWGWAPHLSQLEYTAVALEPEGLPPFPPLLRFRVTCKWLSDTVLSWQGEDVAIRRGTPLQVFFSIRYTPGRFESTARAFGLQPRLEELTSCREEGIWRLSL